MAETAIEEVALYLDVPLDVEVELDRRILTVRQILDLDQDHVIRMNRSAGENLDVRIGGALIGFGEIVVNEATTTGIRITDFKHND
ncbi:Surface presentation of antigens (SPOA) protein [Candidatus Sulfopaludibacter sp. SbA3]|nr:Surface presentation of antigens (SPOA) protein [Candidatus Sulfopaludibacter sp. SbA3]